MEHSTDSIKQKKNYSRLYTSPFADHFKLSSSSDPSTRKKIIPTLAHSGLRDAFKKTFLPLLIDIFELRQMIDTHKLHQQSPQFRHFGKISKTPQEILVQLEQMQRDIQESQRWCEGVIVQIAKGIHEAQEALEGISTSLGEENKKSPHKLMSLKTLLSKLKGWLWTPKPPR